MIRAAIVGMTLIGSALALPGATPNAAAGEPRQVQGASLGAANLDRLGKLVRNYYTFLEAEQLQKANKELGKLLEETGKIAKASKLADPLLALDDWREVVRRGLTVEKPTADISGRGDLRLAAVPSPIDMSEYEKELKDVFDNKMKAFISLPPDFAKVAYPVIVGLHPMDDEVKAAKDLTKSKAIQDKVKAWATATYSKEFLAKAIVVCPVMDLARRSSDNVSWSRPRWDSDDGAMWAFKSLTEFIFKNVNHDATRIFMDGSGSGAMAALLFCARFPGVQTGSVVRGTPPQKIDIGNCLGTPVLFVGAETKEFFDHWKGHEGFVLEQHDAIDDPTLLAWLADHPKNFAPKKITLATAELNYASSYWLRITDQDRTKEKLDFSVDAVVDAEKNEITIVTNEKVKGIEIYLNDSLLDLSKPVKAIHRFAGAEDAAKETVRFNGF